MLANHRLHRGLPPLVTDTKNTYILSRQDKADWLNRTVLLPFPSITNPGVVSHTTLTHPTHRTHQHTDRSERPHSTEGKARYKKSHCPKDRLKKQHQTEQTSDNGQAQQVHSTFLPLYKKIRCNRSPYLNTHTQNPVEEIRCGRPLYLKTHTHKHTHTENPSGRNQM